jgi:hypothetical protein
MSAEKVIMLIVAGLGGYAVYRMVRAPKPAPATPDNTPILDPGLSGVAIPPTLDVVTDGAQVRIAQGRFYRARFESAAGVPGVVDAMLGLGVHGTAYLDAASAAAAGFPAWSVAAPTTSTVWFAGSSDRAGIFSRPAGLALMWTALPH